MFLPECQAVGEVTSEAEKVIGAAGENDRGKVSETGLPARDAASLSKDSAVEIVIAMRHRKGRWPSQRRRPLCSAPS